MTTHHLPRGRIHVARADSGRLASRPCRTKAGAPRVGVVIPVVREVFGLRAGGKVLQPVVQLVAVLVMNDHPARQRTIRFFPDDLRAKLPHVGLRDLHPSPSLASTAMPSADTNRANTQLVLRRLTGLDVAGPNGATPAVCVAGMRAEPRVSAADDFGAALVASPHSTSSFVVEYSLGCRRLPPANSPAVLASLGRGSLPDEGGVQPSLWGAA